MTKSLSILIAAAALAGLTGTAEAQNSGRVDRASGARAAPVTRSPVIAYEPGYYPGREVYPTETIQRLYGQRRSWTGECHTNASNSEECGPMR